MSLPLNFSKAVLQALTGDPEAPETVREWMRDESDPEQRVT